MKEGTGKWVHDAGNRVPDAGNWSLNTGTPCLCSDALWWTEDTSGAPGGDYLLKIKPATFLIRYTISDFSFDFAQDPDLRLNFGCAQLPDLRLTTYDLQLTTYNLRLT
ncbi:MAG TPA: hypothetical protein PKB07_10920, partial [Flavilitoribacter sp.]|nr:hypothetical protein [Flavilitoribacter sp.]